MLDEAHLVYKFIASLIRCSCDRLHIDATLHISISVEVLRLSCKPLSHKLGDVSLPGLRVLACKNVGGSGACCMAQPSLMPLYASLIHLCTRWLRPEEDFRLPIGMM